MSMILKGNSGINFKVDTVDDLLTLEGSEGEVVIVSDENRGGTFVYRSAEVATNNGGTIFNGWCRQFDGAVNVKWFGAKGDGVTDDTAAIQNAIDSGKSLYVNDSTLTFKISSTLYLFGGGVSYDFGFSTILTDSTFPALSHKVFTANVGVGSGQYFTLKNLNITGVSANKYNLNGCGFKVLKDNTGHGYSIYDGTFENITIKDMYIGIDDLDQSGMWMTKLKHVKFVNCPQGFIKSVGTTISLENCYALGGHRGFLLDNVYGFDMISCACDAGTDYATTFLQNRVLITNSQGNIHTLRMEYQTASIDSIIRIDNSKINIDLISLSGATLDASTYSVQAIKINTSNINISKISAWTGITVTGANISNVISVSSSNLNLVNCDLPTITGTSVHKVSNYNSNVFGYGLKDSEITGNGYYQKNNKVTLYISSSGSDTNSGLTTDTPVQTFNAIFGLIQKYYVGHSVNIVLNSSSTFEINGSNLLKLRSLYITNNTSITGTLQFNVSAGVVAKIYGCDELVLNVSGLTINGSPASLASGTIFPSATQDIEYSLDSIQIKATTITLPANGVLTGSYLYGYNGMMSIGLRDSAVTGNSSTTSYICYLASGTAQVTRGGGSLTNCGLTNGTQISTSNLYYA